MSSELWDPSWHHEEVEFKEDNLVYDGFYKVRRLVFRHKCFSGKWSDWLVREQIRRTNAAAVLLVDPKQNKLVMIEQFRVGIVGMESAKSPWILEIVAGLQDEGETPEQTVLREAKEEAACSIQKLIKIGEFYNTPGGFAEKTTLFCGICEAPLEGGIHGVDEDEDILSHVFSIPRVLAAFQKGSLLTSSSTVIALQWLAHHWEKDLSSL